MREVSGEVVGAELVPGIEAEPPEVFRPLRHRRPPLLGEAGVPLLLRQRRERDEHVAALLHRHPVRVSVRLAGLGVCPHRVHLARGERILPEVVRRIVVFPLVRRGVLEYRAQRGAGEFGRGVEQKRQLRIEYVHRSNAAVRAVLLRKVHKLPAGSRHELARGKALPPRERAEPRVFLAAAPPERRHKRGVLRLGVLTHRSVCADRILQHLLKALSVPAPVCGQVAVEPTYRLHVVVRQDKMVAAVDRPGIAPVAPYRVSRASKRILLNSPKAHGRSPRHRQRVGRDRGALVLAADVRAERGAKLPRLRALDERGEVRHRTGKRLEVARILRGQELERRAETVRTGIPHDRRERTHLAGDLFKRRRIGGLGSAESVHLPVHLKNDVERLRLPRGPVRRLAVRQPVVRRPHREERVARHEWYSRRPEWARHSLQRVCARRIVARRAVERDRSDGILGHGEFPDERAVVAIAPRAPDDAVLRLVRRLDFSETPVGQRRQLEAVVEAAVGTGADPCGRAEEPVGKRSVGVVVEAVHVDRSEPLLLRVAVPALPHRRGALVHRKEPARILVLEQQRIRGVGTVGVVGKRVEDLRRPEEARLQASAVVFDVLQERRDGGVLRRAVVKPQPQREDDRRLQVAEYL